MHVPVRIRIFILICLVRYMCGCISANFPLTLEYMMLPQEKEKTAWCIRKIHNISSISASKMPIMPNYDPESLRQELGIKTNVMNIRLSQYNQEIFYWIPSQRDTGARMIKVKIQGPRFSWTTEQVLLAKESYLWGIVIISIPSGILAEFLGPFHIIIYATAMSAILNLIRALVISNNFTHLIIMEFFIGMNLGLVLPAVSVWIARWAPPNERGMFVCAHTGGDFGIAVMGVLSRNLVPFLGWRGIYYLNSSKVLLFCIVAFFLGSSSPEDHRSITAKELRYIKKSQKGKVTSTRSVPPYGEILSSRAFWAINILNFGFFWGLTFQFESTPRYLSNFIGIPKDQVAYMQLFPPLGMIGTSILSAAIGDYIRTKSIIPDTCVVSIFAVVSHILPGLLILFMTMAYCNGNIVYFILFLGASFIGVGNISARRTTIDISPNYAGSVFGLIQLASRSSAIGILRLEERILEYNSGIIGWTIIFLIGGGCLIGTATIFFFFGTGATQWWNQKSQDRRLSARKPGEMEDRSGLTTHRFNDRDEQESRKEDEIEEVAKSSYLEIKEPSIKSLVIKDPSIKSLVIKEPSIQSLID